MLGEPLLERHQDIGKRGGGVHILLFDTRQLATERSQDGVPHRANVRVEVVDDDKVLHIEKYGWELNNFVFKELIGVIACTFIVNDYRAVVWRLFP